MLRTTQQRRSRVAGHEATKSPAIRVRRLRASGACNEQRLLFTMPRKPNYGFEKRRKEQERQKKTEAKREEKLRRKEEERAANPNDAPQEPNTPS